VRVCTIVLQTVCRGFVARQYCKCLRLGPPLNKKLSNDSIFQTERQNLAALMIQSGWKGSSSRRECDALVKCVVMIQSSYRGHQSRQAYRKLGASSITVEHRVKGHHALTHFHSQDPNICFTGSVRQTLTMHSDADAVRIQAWRRMSSTFTTYQNIRMCAIVLQTACRGFMARQHRKHPRLASPLNQLLTNEAMRQSVRQNQATVVIHSVWRAHLNQSEYSALRICVVVIQSSWRGLRSRETNKELRASSSTVQRPNFSAVSRDNDSITTAKSRHLTGQQFASANPEHMEGMFMLLLHRRTSRESGCKPSGLLARSSLSETIHEESGTARKDAVNGSRKAHKVNIVVLATYVCAQMSGHGSRKGSQSMVFSSFFSLSL
jgi:hypothetical protein